MRVRAGGAGGGAAGAPASDPTPEPAATIVLLRPAPLGEPLVFFVKRHAKARFMPRYYVFPGGRLDPGDADEGLLGRVDGVDGAALAERMVGVTSAAAALAHVVAALRETFEEAGVLLAARAGRPVSTRTDELRAWRAALNDGRATFAELVSALDLRLDGGALRYFAHWVTPRGYRHRYDARFFLACAPDGQVEQHDAKETVASTWRSPKEALDAYAGGEDFLLAPPTWSVLRDLAAHATTHDARAWAEAQARPPRIEPRIVQSPQIGGGETELRVLPGDPLYGDGASEDAPPRRLVLRDGRWRDGRWRDGG